MNKNVVVIGDWMWDRYYVATAERVSAEAPIPVCKVERKFRVPGGAGNVVANLRSMGTNVVAAITGEGQIIKNRLMVGDSQVARWDVNDWLTPILPDRVTGLLESHQPKYIVVADYCKGSINESTIRAIHEYKRRDVNPYIFIDTKRDPGAFSALDDFTTYFPNRAEYRQFVASYTGKPRVVVKRGEEGIEYRAQYLDIKSLPSWARYVRNVNGAGDTVIAAWVASHPYLGLDPLKYANAAAAVAVESPFTTAVTNDQVMERYNEKS